MRRAALVATLLVLSGCSGFDKWLTDTATLPGENPNTPAGTSETIRRVRGQSFAEAPILPDGGNIWPGAPKPLPSLSDVASDHDTVAGMDGQKGELPDGGHLSLGEDVDDSFSGKGATASLPSVEPDVAGKYGAGAKSPNSTIEIPNGDGTTTVIHPDGSISTVKSSTLHHDRGAVGNGSVDKAVKHSATTSGSGQTEMVVPVTPLVPGETTVTPPPQ